jgi:hypothetical protein
VQFPSPSHGAQGSVHLSTQEPSWSTWQTLQAEAQAPPVQTPLAHSLSLQQSMNAKSPCL